MGNQYAFVLVFFNLSTREESRRLLSTTYGICVCVFFFLNQGIRP